MALKSRNYKSKKFLFPCREGEVVCFHPALPQPLLPVANLGRFEGRKADLRTQAP